MADMKDTNTPDVPANADWMDKTLLKPARVAAMLDLSRSAVYEKIAKGELPSVRIGRSIRVPAKAIREMLEWAASAA